MMVSGQNGVREEHYPALAGFRQLPDRDVDNEEILQPGTVLPVPVAAASVPDGLQWKWDSSLAWKGRFYGG